MAKKVTAEVRVKFKDDGASTGAKKVAGAVGGMGKAIASSADGAAKAQGRLSKFSSFLKSKFVITLGDVSRAVGAAFKAIKDSADLASVTNSLRLSLGKQGQDFDTYIGTLEKVSRGTVSTADLIKSSSKALLLGIPAKEIAGLLDIARASAIATGRSVRESFDDIATGIGRSSPLILDNLGIVVKIGVANEEYAKSLGKTSSELTATETKQALLNSVLKTGKKRIEEFGESADATAIALQRGQAAMADFRIVTGKLATALITRVAGGFTVLAVVIIQVTKGIQGLRLAWNKWRGDTEDVLSLEKSIASLNKLSLSLEKTARGLLNASTAQFNDLLSTTAEKTEVANKKLGVLVEKQEAVAVAAKEAAVETENLGETIEVLGDAAEETASVNQNSLLPALQTVGEQMSANITIADNMALSFDRVSQATGRASAVQAIFAANVAAGDPTGGLSLGVTRIDLPGGGSRLVPPGTFSNISTNGGSRQAGDGAFSRPFLGA